MPGPIDIPWPLSSFPGAAAQESGGRLINVTAEPLGDANADKIAWHRQPGLSLFAQTSQTGYRGGLIVNNTSYDVWSGEAVSISSAGAVTLLGSLSGTKKVSIARNQLAVSPNIIVVDIDNGAYDLTSGAPVSYNASGVLPQPNSVAFQDSYLFFSIGDGRIFATGNNSLTINSQTFTTCQAKSDVTLYRVIAYSGLLFAFTSASCEVYQDTANAAPGFPYSRAVVLEYGLAQPTAIAGWETGFSNLCWVAQDYGVYNLPPGSLAPVKISPPDLDRLIEAQVRAGNLLDVLVYTFAGKKFFAISSPTWSWECNLNTNKWNERQSVNGGIQGRWRATCSHFAFGKWLVGDAQSGNLLYIDDQNYTEMGSPQLARMESGPVVGFPNRQRVPRADFDFVTGVGQVARQFTMTVTGTSAASNGEIILNVNDTSQVATNDEVTVSSVGGTTEANGTWPVRSVPAFGQIQLQGSKWANAWTSGGTAVDITTAPNTQNPSVAISWSNDDGVSWKNPVLRGLGQQGKSLRTRVSVKNTGISGPQARRWRLDVTDPVYFGFFGGKQSTDPREN